jgi:hypothetical protein
MIQKASSRRIISATAFLLLVAIVGRVADAADSLQPATVLQDVRLFSGMSDSFEDHMSIKIENGVITEVANKIDAKGARVLQMRNRSVIPGLIDAHVHLKSIPGAVQRQDDEATTKKFFAQQMRAYVASGVTSVLDAAAPPSVIKIVNDYSVSGAPGPSVYYLTPFITPKDGYFSNPDLRTPVYSDMPAPIVKAEDLSVIFSPSRTEREVGAKVTFEDGFGPVAVWRTFDKTMREAILRESQQRGIPLFIHSMKEAMTAIAFELKPRGLMHVGFQRGRPSAELLRSLKASGASVVSTQAVFDMPLVEYEKERLDNPWVQSLVPKPLLDTAKDPSVIKKWRETMIEVNSPSWIPAFIKRSMTSIFYNEREIHSQVSSTKFALKQMYDAGIPIVMGSDAGCWPVIPFMFHGVSSIRELEVMVDAGIPTLDVIRAATINAARMIGVEGRIGSVSVGKSADLVIYDDDPTIERKSFRRPAYVMKAGILRTPAEWLDDKSPL